MLYQEQDFDAINNPAHHTAKSQQQSKKNSDSTGIIGDHKKSRDETQNDEERGESP